MPSGLTLTTARQIISTLSLRVVLYAKNAYNYLHVHVGDLLRDMRLMLVEVQ